MPVVLFFIFFFIATSYEQRSNKYKYTILSLACFTFALIAGLRDAWAWPDAAVYMWSFHSSPDIFNFSFSDRIIGYSEKGLYWIGVIVRTFTDNYHIFFVVVSLLSFFLMCITAFPQWKCITGLPRPCLSSEYLIIDKLFLSIIFVNNVLIT